MLNRVNLLSLLAWSCSHGKNNGIVVTGFTTTNTPSTGIRHGYSYQTHSQQQQHTIRRSATLHEEDDDNDEQSSVSMSRRSYLTNGVWAATAAIAATTTTATVTSFPHAALAAVASSEDNKEPTTTQESIYAPKFVQQYDDFTETPEGWSYRIVKEGPQGGEIATVGDRVVFDWSGYTIGYFGRPFEAKGGPQGGAFDKDLDYSRTVLGSGTMVKGLESALVGMKPGDIRQVVVPYGSLSYPPTTDGDATHDKVGPKPTTFSGQRALNFVLDNPRVDRTLLFNVKIMRVDKPNGKGGFVRGG